MIELILLFILLLLATLAKLKEVIQYTFYGKSYKSSATTVTSNVSLSQDEVLIGTLKRNHIMSNIQVIEVPGDQPEFIIALIIHSYFFKNK